MAVELQNPITGSDATYTETALHVSQDVNITNAVSEGSFYFTNDLYLGSKVWAGTIPWVIAGSVWLAATYDNGSPCFKNSLVIVSGTYNDVWVPKVGSRVGILGYDISTDSSGLVILLNSGTTPVSISTYYFNINGGNITKDFSFPFAPGSRNMPIGIGTTVAGSTYVTIFGRDIK
jgi:hypothetical protein